jgi:hypothetical protein
MSYAGLLILNLQKLTSQLRTCILHFKSIFKKFKFLYFKLIYFNILDFFNIMILKKLKKNIFKYFQTKNTLKNNSKKQQEIIYQVRHESITFDRNSVQ